MYRYFIINVYYVVMVMADSPCWQQGDNHATDPRPTDLAVEYINYAVRVSWKMQPSPSKFLICICTSSKFKRNDVDGCHEPLSHIGGEVRSYMIPQPIPNTMIVFKIKTQTGNSYSERSFNISDGSPTINSSISDDSYVVGENASLHCPIYGFKLFYSWWKGGNLLSDSQTLNIQRLSTFNSGNYTCKANSEQRKKTKEFNIQVHVKACESTRELSTISLKKVEGFHTSESGVVSFVQRKLFGITFQCQPVIESNGQTFIQWYKGDFKLEAEKNMFHNFSMTLSNVNDQNVGRYTCIVSNCHTYTRRVFDLTVVDYIKGQQDLILKVLEGNSETLHSSIESSSGNYIWLKFSSSNITDKRKEKCFLRIWFWYLKESLSCEAAMTRVTHWCPEAKCLQSNKNTFFLNKLNAEDSGLYISLVVAKSGLQFDQFKIDVQKASIVILLLILVILIRRKKHYNTKMSVENTLYEVCEEEQIGGDHGEIDTTEILRMYPSTTSSEQRSIMDATVSSMSFPVNRLTIGEVIGEGGFGVVYLAQAVGIRKGEEVSKVAVKKLKDTATRLDFEAFLDEIHMMKKIGRHTNIINLLGCCTHGDQLLVIIEYAERGNLRDCLRLNRPPVSDDSDTHQQQITLQVKDLFSSAYQVAKGMEYLSSKKCIHRDLAARNILVTEDFVMKIADFGFACDMKSMDYYRKDSKTWLPIKWMSPETMSDYIFTTQSDVWSFGVLLWEIMTLGMTPYPSVPTNMILKYLMDGQRLSQPRGCSLQIYHIMRECWQLCPERRPTFTELVQDLSRILHEKSNQEYLDLDVGIVTAFSIKHTTI
ncbi:fibroblast growth factor receptor 3-like isoform X2 [Antedon mediterranea]|uniref:fibroblast growth factor receptor 3-like isoform X2 n=1 Tax=Antedon mediterranea TaxID=105859 RepID=UPI003AF65DFC